MSIMTDARLRLLESRVAEIERRLAERVVPEPGAWAQASAPVQGPAVKKNAPKIRKRSRKST
jgi:hypothetical protein